MYKDCQNLAPRAIQPCVATSYTHVPRPHWLSSFCLSALPSGSQMHPPVWNPGLPTCCLLCLDSFLYSFVIRGNPTHSSGLHWNFFRVLLGWPLPDRSSFTSLHPGYVYHTCNSLTQCPVYLQLSLPHWRVCLLYLLYPQGITQWHVMSSINVCWMSDDEWLMGKFYCF